MTKKYVLLMLLMTAVVVGHFAVKQWSEARRLRQIRQAKQQAAQIEATPLADFLTQLEGASPEKTLLVLYTGNTQAHLEPCGCFIGQSGGLPRRAAALSLIRERGFSLLLVDLGGILPAEVPRLKPSALQEIALANEGVETLPDPATHSLDRLRVQTALEAMARMGYQALVPGGAESNFGTSFVPEVLGNQPFPLLAANQKASALLVQPFLLKTIGGKTVALIGLSALEKWNTQPVLDTLDSLLSQLQGQAAGVVILSNLSKEMNREIARQYPNVSAILSHETGEAEQVGNVLLAYSSAEGKTLSALTLSHSGERPTVSTYQIALTEEVADDPEVRKLLNDFYERVAKDPQLQAGGKPLFFDEPHQRDGQSAYVGSSACKECHQKEFDQWSHTSHAAAFNTLLTVGRQFYPECVSCHVTGFGSSSGYQIGNSERKHLAEVGCETCHGPGKGHTYTPLASNIRGHVEARICMECHTAEHSPGFDQIVEHVMPEVDHSRKEPSLKQILEQRLRGPMKPQVELFVMSYCPFGTAAEKELLPFLKKYGDAIDFKLRFIANEKEKSEGKAASALQFSSLHGETEVMEDLRQMVIAELYPNQFFDYLLCRAGHLQEAWIKCAKKVGLDIGRIAREIETEQTKQRFLEHVRRTEELGIKGSPTLVIDGREISDNLWRGKVSGACR